ncbi:protein NEOXANTHIN-DEFICIENT 1 isoform X2 [Ricinus communis]|uniref:protein NEOXANTHIN-DEFICIENT 1 isoform X2 n=1 Tax=Ricinus communis TaxID=3988 RepID=UPI0007721399|nr:protein NEOXANTHIN-DEFICIENT 1 isoform X2 [Ricinus communis]
MKVAETKSSQGYGKAPWIFKGSALYQLHLVKAETARAFIPKEFRLVEAFGYTLGGFFLANYEDSPAGAFDELVVIAGIVWNPPTSCAWAARVLVSSDDACDHGRKEVGLPSHVARFSKRNATIARQRTSKYNHFLDPFGLGTALSRPDDRMDVQVTEINGASTTNICNINLATAVPGIKWMGPAIKMSLPSFSGRTEHNPNLLKYSCNIECRVRAVRPAEISVPFPASKHRTEESLGHHNCKIADSVTGEILDNAPSPVSHCSKSSCRTSLGVS